MDMEGENERRNISRPWTRSFQPCEIQIPGIFLLGHGKPSRFFGNAECSRLSGCEGQGALGGTPFAHGRLADDCFSRSRLCGRHAAQSTTRDSQSQMKWAASAQPAKCGCRVETQVLNSVIASTSAQRMTSSEARRRGNKVTLHLALRPPAAVRNDENTTWAGQGYP
jgi:hypothetical protein